MWTKDQTYFSTNFRIIQSKSKLTRGFGTFITLKSSKSRNGDLTTPLHHINAHPIPLSFEPQLDLLVALPNGDLARLILYPQTISGPKPKTFALTVLPPIRTGEHKATRVEAPMLVTGSAPVAGNESRRGRILTDTHSDRAETLDDPEA